MPWELQRFWVCSKWQSEMTCDICLGWALWRVGIAACLRGLLDASALMGGFALLEALWLRVTGVSEPHVVQFPRLVAVRSRFEGVCAPKCRLPR